MLFPEFPPGASYGMSGICNQLEVGLSFASIMSYIASPLSMPDSAFKEYSDGSLIGHPYLASMNVDFMRGGNGHEILSASVQIGFSQILLVLTDVSETQRNVFMGMILATSFVALFIFSPIIIRVDLAGDRIMLQFVAIPASVRKILYETAAQRIQLLRRDYADDDEESDNNDDDFGDKAGDGEQQPGRDNMTEKTDDDLGDAGAVRLTKALHDLRMNTEDSGSLDSGSKKSNTGSSIYTDKIVDKALTEASSSTTTSAAARRPNSRALHQKDSTTVAVLLLKFISPLLILVVLFSSVFATFTAQAERITSLSAILVSSGVRAGCARQALVDLRKTASLTTDFAYISRNFYLAMSSLNCVRAQVRLLGSGTIDPSIADVPFTLYTETPENGLPSFLSAKATALVHKAMYGNACEFLATNGGIANFNISRCELFGGGVLKLGLAPLCEMWWKNGYLFNERQTRALFKASPQDLYQGNGWLYKPSEMNYSGIICNPENCYPNAVTKPMRTGILPASYFSDPSYTGDVTPDGSPGDGVSLLLADMSADSEEYHIGAELHSVELDWMERCDARFLTPGLLAVTEIYLHEARDSISTFLSFVAFFVPLLVSLFTVIILVWFLPASTSENKLLQTKRAMLLYLPLVVIGKIKSIKRLVDEIITGDQADSLTSKRSGKVAPH